MSFQPSLAKDLHRGLATLLGMAPMLAMACLAVAEEPTSDKDWMRVHQDKEEKPLSLQTAIGRYEGAGPKGSVVVDLVGAVHVGDKSYYRELNKRFRDYDVVLYELVAAPETRIERGLKAKNDNPLGVLQNGMKATLGLEHQLEFIDYTRPNFVHADMTPTQMLESMKKREESFLKMYFRMVGQSIAQQSEKMAAGESMEIDLFKAVVSDNREQNMKIVLANQMADMEGMLDGLGGKQGSTLINERNRIAFEVLDRELKRGRRKVAVFYGAGHLSDMDKRLTNDFGLRQTGKDWVNAWDLTD